MIVVTNRIPVASGFETAFEERFRRRARLVDRAPGFVRNEVHRPLHRRFDRQEGRWVDDPDTPGWYEVKTWWRSFEDFVRWTESEAFVEAHRDRPPAEMFAGPNVLELHEVCESSPAG